MDLVRSSRSSSIVIYSRTSFVFLREKHINESSHDYVFKPRTSPRTYELHELRELT